MSAPFAMTPTEIDRVRRAAAAVKAAQDTYRAPAPATNTTQPAQRRQPVDWPLVGGAGVLVLLLLFAFDRRGA